MNKNVHLFSWKTLLNKKLYRYFVVNANHFLKWPSKITNSRNLLNSRYDNSNTRNTDPDHHNYIDKVKDSLRLFQQIPVLSQKLSTDVNIRLQNNEFHNVGIIPKLEKRSRVYIRPFFQKSVAIWLEIAALAPLPINKSLPPDSACSSAYLKWS